MVWIEYLGVLKFPWYGLILCFLHFFAIYFSSGKYKPQNFQKYLILCFTEER